MELQRQYLHRAKMFEILRAIYSSKFGSILWFKWWTALYFFYNLSRFSVDCDFDIIKDLDTNQLKELKQELLIYLQNKLPDLKIKTSGTSDYSIRYIAQYWWNKTIKIEISPKMYNNQYEIKNLQWLQVQVMKKEWMFAHKLCAFISRYLQRDTIANRDIYDINFLSKSIIFPYKPIIEERFSKMIGKKISFEESIEYIIQFIEKHQKDIQKNITNWLWELVDDNKKKNIKNNLINETIQNLKLFTMK